ncbi:plasmid pRiA4b ORF-3 family protein [Rhodococcus erythropolis]|uniref:plasmid pRiA4b ORF-3 family protein n=1 Tax=Rhodococcus TaxID=1827 RepID=UPI0019820F0F|nr:plasmid pRiA4b ORF-3 family protein [Rhodococcus erythropolis]PBI96322.1 Plasmid pRiA4b ORF-3-like protein [Rhodococcus erythropolis]
MVGLSSSRVSHLRLVPTEPEELQRFVQEVGGERGGFPFARSLRSQRRSVPAQYAIRISVDNVSTQIWRRILVTSDLNLDDLHSVVQQAMGWSDLHSHAWSKSGRRFPGEVEEYVASGSNAEQRRPGRVAVVESAVRLDEVMVLPGDELSYRYGRYGNWRHTLTLESSDRLPDGFQVVCAAGRGACPPEECVGPDEYEQLLGVLASEKLRSHEWTLEWPQTEFEPTRFEIAEVNGRLSDRRTSRPDEIVAPYDVAKLVECLEPARVPELHAVLDRAGIEDRSAVGKLIHLEAGHRLQAVLTLIGVEGIEADDFFTTVDAMLDEPELGPVNLPKGRSLFAVLKRFGLVRKHKGQIVLTKRGQSAQRDASMMWSVIVEGVPVAPGGSQRAVELLALLAVAAGMSPSDRHRFVSRALEPIRASSILMSGAQTSKRDTSGSTVEVLGLIGATGYELGKFGTKADSSWAPYLARAILQR